MEKSSRRSSERGRATRRCRPAFDLLGESQRDSLPFAQQRVQAQCPPVPERHSTRVLATRVRIASMASSEATAKAATKLYSL